jgi:hypothetical protein
MKKEGVLFLGVLILVFCLFGVVQAGACKIDTVLVNDVSYSMCTLASGHILYTSDNNCPYTSNPTSRIYLSKQAATRFIQKIYDSDNSGELLHRIGLVTFSNYAEIKYPGAYVMTNKDNMIATVETYKPIDQTNIYDGLSKALDLFDNANPSPESRGAKKVIILLSDGEYTLGEIPCL